MKWWLLLWSLLCCLSTPAFAHSVQGVGHAQRICAAPDVACAATVTVAAAASGQVWRAFANGKTLYVQMRKIDGSFSTPLPVNVQPETILNRGETRIQMALGTHDDIYLVWVTPRTKAYSSDVRFSYSRNGGESFSTPITINHDGMETMHNFPVLAVNAQHQVFIAWLDMRAMAQAETAGKPMPHDVTADLYYNWSADEGEHFQAQDTLLKAGACLCCHLAMTLNEKGLPLLFFRDVYLGSLRDHSLIRFASPTAWAAPERISFDDWQLNGCPEQGPTFLQVGARTHFMWYDKGRLYYRQEEAGKLSPVTSVGEEGAQRPTLAMAAGVLYRSWESYQKDVMRVWLQTSADQGAHWSKARQVATTAGASDYPQLVSDGKKVWLSWLTDDAGYQWLPLEAK